MLTSAGARTQRAHPVRRHVDHVWKLVRIRSRPMTAWRGAGADAVRMPRGIPQTLVGVLVLVGLFAASPLWGER